MIYPLHREIIYSDNKISFLILSRHLAASTKPKVPYVIISVTNFEFTKLAKSPNRKDVLRLSFKDDKYSINDAQVAQIVSFVEKNIDIPLFVIHCEVGMSRSAGIGAAISQVLNGDSSLFFKYYGPNQIVYEKVLAALTYNKVDEK